jgi:SET domain-containing protein
MNFLMESSNTHKWKVLIKKLTKKSKNTMDSVECSMWGLFALEEIPAGAFVTQYTGEVLTKKEGDKRGAVYD